MVCTLSIADWGYYLLAILTPTLALWIAWQQFADYLDLTKCLVALCLLTFIPFFNFIALKFNVNTVLMPLWAATTFWFLRSYRTQNATYAALAGVGAALCMTSKYWSICLIAGLTIAALSDARRGAYFRSAAPWITILTGIAILSPHIGWLEKHDFSPMEYAMSVHGGHSIADAVLADLRYLVDAMAYVLVPVAAVLLVARAGPKTIADMAWPATRSPIGGGYILGDVAAANLAGAGMGRGNPRIWSMSSWTLLPVMLLSPPTVKIARPSVLWILGFAVTLPLGVLIAAPAVALALHVQA